MPNTSVRAARHRLAQFPPRAVLGAILAGSAATAAAALPAMASAAVATDPIFALIERHRPPGRVWAEACNLTDEVQAEEEGREVTEADELAYDTANAAEQALFDELMDTPPVTTAGAAAILRYLIRAIIPRLTGPKNHVIGSLATQRGSRHGPQEATETEGRPSVDRSAIRRALSERRRLRSLFDRAPLAGRRSLPSLWF